LEKYGTGYFETLNYLDSSLFGVVGALRWYFSDLGWNGEGWGFG
jgi:hypothetical protein